jgi:hypothetical protein
MKNIGMRQFIFASICLTMTVCMSCNKEETPDAGIQISNGSFESDGSFSTSDWTVANGSSSTDVPTGGGSFSLKLSPGTSPAEGYADYIISDLTGSQTFNLSCYMRAFDSWPGSISLKKRTADNVTTILASEASSAGEWVEKNISATATFDSGDVLIVHLSSGSTEIPVDTKYVLFDLVTLTQ